MKQIFVMLLALILAFSCMTAMAEGDLGVQVIGGDSADFAPMSLDDIQIGSQYTIDGYAKVDVISFDYYDSFAQYNKDFPGDNSHEDNYNKDSSLVYWDSGSWYHVNAHWNDSGSSAEFAWLMLDLVNLQKKDVSFMGDISVKAVFDDEYEFTGWVRQINHDYRTAIFRHSYDGKYYVAETGEKQMLSDYALDPSNEEPISQMYRGSYIIGCTLPNDVVESNAPLRIEINLGGNELTYNIRK